MNLSQDKPQLISTGTLATDMSADIRHMAVVPQDIPSQTEDLTQEEEDDDATIEDCGS